ncbi:TetR/AcrR family transcriptional regulator [Streptomyces sp. NPDC058391]|uniref:TetR/AcrR family transcriptional regulator n=1 Tax=Streptomyces sp. NPDC058391 TaxID=3346476 RepID=UPI0036617FA9
MPRQSHALQGATPSRIAGTALSIIDEDGPSALSFRGVAERLGVSHATIFRRCSDLAGLLDLCADHLAAQLPDIAPDADWARATETRFGALYQLLTAHPGLATLRGTRPWLGRELLARLTEPQIAANIAAGMSPRDAVATYRRMYLLTLGSAGFVDHRHPGAATAATRTALAPLDPSRFPVLTEHLDAVLAGMSDHEVYYGALRQLIRAAVPTSTVARDS